MTQKINPAAYHLTGRRIDGGRLELLSVLGSGAYGVVYLALDTSSPPEQSTWYAVKCLTKANLDSRQRKFQRREIALHQLASAHPGVVTLHRVLEEADWIFVVLDFCPDGDLFAMITEQQVYLGKDTLIKNAFLQIVSAVEYCHTLGIQHRDLKPENILCRNGGTTLLLGDFGLATSEKTSNAFGCGSSFYMSPECQGGVYVKGVPYSTRANDVWALGVILVNLTCGRNPWKQANIADDTFRAYLTDPNFLRKILPVSTQLNDILKRVFTINPQKRMTLSEMREAILDVQTFTMTEDELLTAHSAVRKVAVQQKAVAQPKPRVVVAPPTPIVIPNPSDVDSNFNSTSDISSRPSLSPTTFRHPHQQDASSGSDGSIILTPEAAPVQDTSLAVIPAGDLDGEWSQVSAGVQPVVVGKRRDNVPVKEQPAPVIGRGFLRDVVRKIRAL